ncbi:MAG: hypothetical protein IPP51_07680 [Bacteroidetes bacterium]|nr:hypothetical protein [Bacteroidota bacterium]
MNLRFYALLLIVLMSLKTTAQTTLWSMSPGGGTSGAGAIYKISADGSALSNEYNFPVTGFVGASPEGNTQCLASNGKIYGTMTQGGLYDAGLIYSYDITTSTFTALYHFKGESDGNRPTGSLMQASNGLLYGMTPSGGANSLGVIFSFDITSGTYTKLYDFAPLSGNRPSGGLIEASNGLLYGMTRFGGNSNAGMLFSYNIGSSTLTNLFEFSSTSGSLPFGNLKQSLNGKLYGMTSLGGSTNQGAIFSYDITTSTYSKRFDFSSTSGYFPRGGLMETTSGLFYGMTSIGGTNADGVLIQLR